MFKKHLLTILTISSVSYTSVYALTLKESVVEAMNTNPVVQERLKNYRATQQDLNIAESEYYPKLDFRTSFGHTEAGGLKDDESGSYNHLVTNQDYENYEASLILTQNLFDGFGTMNKVDYEEARILAAAYNYIEKANDIAFKMTSSYIDVMRSYELLQNARENVEINEAIFNKVRDLYGAGLTTDSEVKKIESALALSKSNLTVQLNNTRDTEFTFRRILGRMPDVATMVKPNIDVPMPEDIERAALYAVNHNPSLLVSRYNIKGAQSLWKQNEKDFYPKIDLEVSQNYNDASERNSFDQPDDRFRARIVLNYNIFNGGADVATSQKNMSKINQEVEIQRDLKRQVIEGMDLSWNAYEMIGLQLKDLQQYKDFSAKTLELYKEEYDLGRRSLLDLLAAQNDFINSRAQIITAEYAQLFAKYRILDAMGLLPMAVSGNEQDYASRVNLYTGEEAHEVLDTVPVKLDVDGDNIPDNEDLCDNSLLENNIMPYGCKKLTRDADDDGVNDAKDQDSLTPKDAKVSTDGLALDTDQDGIKDFEDLCPDTPLGYTVDKSGCTSAVTITVNFQKNSTEISDELREKIDSFAAFMQQNPNFKANIIGHSSRTSVSQAEYNLKLSKQRADTFKNELIKRGVASNRLSTEGKGFEEPIADNATQEGRYLNRRLEIELSK